MPDLPHDYPAPADIPASRRERKTTALAAAWRPDAQLEAIDRVGRSDPAALATLSPVARMALGYYVTARSAASATGLEVTT